MSDLWPINPPSQTAKIGLHWAKANAKAMPLPDEFQENWILLLASSGDMDQRKISILRCQFVNESLGFACVEVWTGPYLCRSGFTIRNELYGSGRFVLVGIKCWKREYLKSTVFYVWWKIGLDLISGGSRNFRLKIGIRLFLDRYLLK